MIFTMNDTKYDLLYFLILIVFNEGFCPLLNCLQKHNHQKISTLSL